MTIVAAYTLDDQALFVIDFRLSLEKNQMDILIKFEGLDNRFGIFVAGDVRFWKQAISRITEVLPKVTFNNVLDFDGPLRELISSEAMVYTGNDSGALAFLLDVKSNRNKIFKINIHAGQGGLITEIPNGEATVIGSGGSIPNIQERLNNTLSGVLKTHSNNELVDFGHLMRTKILNVLDECGSMSFQKLGISPCMAISIIKGSHFHMVGETVNGSHYSELDINPYKYSFTRNLQGEICLTNLDNNKAQKLESFMSTADYTGEIFDPAFHTSKIDYSEALKETDQIYIIHQWVTPGFGVYRSLKSVHFVTDNRLCQFSEPIINLLELLEEEKHYPDCRDVPFQVAKELQDQFESEISEAKLFDHEWLSSFLPQYYSNLYQR